VFGKKPFTHKPWLNQNYMAEELKTHQVTADEVSRYAANMFLTGKNSYEVKTELLKRGLSEDDIDAIIDNVEGEVVAARKAKGQKEMLYGALWCLGGIILTAANIGYIFWGAIIFGAIRFFRGVSKLS
jgi:hypothetical protein